MTACKDCTCCTIKEGERVTLVIGDKIVYLEVIKIRDREFPTKDNMPTDPAIVGLELG
jgi:hypothetical protein